MVSRAATFKVGMCISPALIVMATSLDALEEDQLSKLAFYERDDEAEPWGFLDLWEWKVESICLWKDFRVCLDEEGRVFFSNKGAKNQAKMQIPDAGVWRKGAKGYGYVNRIRAIGDGLYVCGACRQVYRYNADAQNPLKGRFVDMAGSMRQVLPKPPQRNRKAFRDWVATTNEVLFNDIAGSAEDDIYVTGDETWHWDGETWRQIPLETRTMYVIKVLDRERVLIGGDNGALFLGNVRAGFVRLSTATDTPAADAPKWFDITGLEWFDGRLFIASDRGLFTMTLPDGKLTPLNTGLTPEFQRAHMLEAMDGVLWSFGYKDLAYFDSRQPDPCWVRAQHPDNPPVGSEPEQEDDEDDDDVSPSASGLPAWLPPPPESPGTLDIGGLLARVGHSGIGAFVLEQLTPFGLTPSDIFKADRPPHNYEVAVPQQGVTLVLQYTGDKCPVAEAHCHPERWGLAEVRLDTRNADPQDYWQGAWPGGIDPYADAHRQANRVWGKQAVLNVKCVAYFIDGSYGAAWNIALLWDQEQRMTALHLAHLGGYLPWDASQ